MKLPGNRVRALAAAGVLTVAGAAGTIVTVVHAQQPTPTPAAGAQQRQQAADEYLSRLAQNLGVSVDKLRDALKQTALQEVDAAQAAGRITAQQAQQAKDRITSGNGAPFGFGFGLGPGGPGFGDHHGFFANHDQIAQFLGITAQQLHDELNGKSLAQVAQAHGKTRDQLIQFIVNTAQQQLAADVQAGRITQQQADQRLTDLKNRVGDMVDRVMQRPQMGQGRTQ